MIWNAFNEEHPVYVCYKPNIYAWIKICKQVGTRTHMRTHISATAHSN